MSVYQPVRDARLAWERTQPQLFFDFSEPAVGDHEHASPYTVITAATSPSTTSPAGGAPTAEPTTRRPE